MSMIAGLYPGSGWPETYPIGLCRSTVTRAVSARPRELLAALEINDLERASGPLARTKVELYD